MITQRKIRDTLDSLRENAGQPYIEPGDWDRLLSLLEQIHCPITTNAQENAPPCSTEDPPRANPDTPKTA